MKINNRVRKEIVNYTLIILFIVLIKASVFGNYLVPTGSMNPTIVEGDRIFSNNAAYSFRIPFSKYHLIRWGVPQKGDVISFVFPGDNKTDYTKRVIGAQGDRIVIKNKRVYINGELVFRNYIKEDNGLIFYEEFLDDNKYYIQESAYSISSQKPLKVVVPKDHLFVMGDNRDNSYDSRFWGFVPIENVIGRLEFCYFSVDPVSNDVKLDRIGRIR